MKRFVFLLCAVTLLVAQAAAPEVEITAEPHHHFLFENKYVRVFDVEVPSHADTLMHWHRHDYIFVTLGATHISNNVKGKAPAELHLADGYTILLSAPFAHVARNLSDQPFRNVTIELLEDDKLRQTAGSVHWDEERGLDILPGGTKEILFVKDGVRVSELELQPGGVIPQHHHAGPHLVVALTGFELRNDVEGKSATSLKMSAGESKWVPGEFTHSITNTGKGPAKFVTLEFP